MVWIPIAVIIICHTAEPCLSKGPMGLVFFIKIAVSSSKKKNRKIDFKNEIMP